MEPPASRSVGSAARETVVFWNRKPVVRQIIKRLESGSNNAAAHVSFLNDQAAALDAGRPAVFCEHRRGVAAGGLQRSSKGWSAWGWEMARQQLFEPIESALPVVRSALAFGMI